MRNRHGDTALTISAQLGLPENIKTLLYYKRGPVKTSLRNKLGHNALELSQLYQHRECYDLLEHYEFHVAKNMRPVPPVVNFFDHNPLDRCASKRSDKTWLQNELTNPDAGFILFHKSKPVVSHKDKKFRTFKPEHKDITRFIEPNHQNVIFLGKEFDNSTGTIIDCGAWFAIDVKDMELLKENFKEEELDTLPMYPGALLLDEEDAAIYGQARSLLDWHFRYVTLFSTIYL